MQVKKSAHNQNVTKLLPFEQQQKNIRKALHFPSTNSNRPWLTPTRAAQPDMFFNYQIKIDYKHKTILNRQILIILGCYNGVSSMGCEWGGHHKQSIKQPSKERETKLVTRRRWNELNCIVYNEIHVSTIK